MGGKTSTTNQSSTQSIPPEVLARYNAVNSRAESAAATPFTPYSLDPNAFVAPLTQTQTAGINNINSATSIPGPYFGAATGATLAGAGQVNPDQITGQSVNQYLSPYLGTVLGTTAALQNQANAQQAQQLKSQAIQGGAFGGDRAGIAQANLAQQQGLASGKVYSDILNQGYGQALGTAVQQQGVGLGAQQANLARLSGAGQQLAGLGAGAQQAALTGGQAQIGAGTAQQQTQQAGLSALLNQFLQQQGYPFQTAQFLSNIALGTGALSGSTTGGTTTQPSSFFSDARMKDNIEPIGKTFDGQDIVKFNYKGSPLKRIGLIAQDVEKRHPDAVGVAGGMKTVDYDKATKEAAHKGHYAYGGLVPQSEGGAVYEQHAGQGFAVGGVAGNSSDAKLEQLLQMLAPAGSRRIDPYGSSGTYTGSSSRTGPYNMMLGQVPNRINPGAPMAQQMAPRPTPLGAIAGSPARNLPQYADGGGVAGYAPGGMAVGGYDSANLAAIIQAQRGMYKGGMYSDLGGGQGGGQGGGIKIPVQPMDKVQRLEAPQLQQVRPQQSDLQQGFGAAETALKGGETVGKAWDAGKGALYGAAEYTDPKTGKVTSASTGALGSGGESNETGYFNKLFKASSGGVAGQHGYATGGLPYSNAINEYVPEDETEPPKTPRTLPPPQGGVAGGSSGPSTFQDAMKLAQLAAMFMSSGGVAGRHGYEIGGDVENMTPEELTAYQMGERGLARTPDVAGDDPAIAASFNAALGATPPARAPVPVPGVAPAAETYGPPLSQKMIDQQAREQARETNASKVLERADETNARAGAVRAARQGQADDAYKTEYERMRRYGEDMEGIPAPEESKPNGYGVHGRNPVPVVIGPNKSTTPAAAAAPPAAPTAPAAAARTPGVTVGGLYGSDSPDAQAVKVGGLFGSDSPDAQAPAAATRTPTAGVAGADLESAQAVAAAFGATPKTDEALKKRDFFPTRESWLVPLLKGLGTMASSNSRYFGAAALQGGMGAAEGYEKYMNEVPVRAKGEAETLNTLMEASNKAFTQDGKFVRLADGKQMNVWDWFAIPYKTRPMTMGGPQAAAAADKILTTYQSQSRFGTGATPAAATTTTTVPADAAPADADLAAPSIFIGDASRRLGQDEGNASLGLNTVGNNQASTNYQNLVREQAQAASENAANVNSLLQVVSEQINKGGIGASGTMSEARASVVRAANTLARVLGGVGNFDTADKLKDLFNKLNAQSASNRTLAVDQRSLGALQTFINAMPNGSIDNDASAQISAQMVVSEQIRKDRAEHLSDYNRVNGRLNSYVGAQEAFEKDNRARYNNEEKILKAMILNYDPKGMEMLTSGKGSKEGIEKAAQKVAEEIGVQYLPGFARYFPRAK